MGLVPWPVESRMLHRESGDRAKARTYTCMITLKMGPFRGNCKHYSFTTLFPRYVHILLNETTGTVTTSRWRGTCLAKCFDIAPTLPLYIPSMTLRRLFVGIE
jgi:hypothetical protein